MARPSTKSSEQVETLTVYANKKLKSAIILAAAENGQKAAPYVFDILSNHPDVKKAMKKIS